MDNRQQFSLWHVFFLYVGMGRFFQNWFVLLEDVATVVDRDPVTAGACQQANSMCLVRMAMVENIILRVPAALRARFHNSSSMSQMACSVKASRLRITSTSESVERY